MVKTIAGPFSLSCATFLFRMSIVLSACKLDSCRICQEGKKVGWRRTLVAKLETRPAATASLLFWLATDFANIVVGIYGFFRFTLPIFRELLAFFWLKPSRKLQEEERHFARNMRGFSALFSSGLLWGKRLCRMEHFVQSNRR